MRHLVAAAFAASLVLTACGGGSDGTAATVNGETISETDVTGMLSDRGGELSDEDFAAFLGLLVQWEATEQAAAEQFGATVSDEDVDAEIARVMAESGLADLDALLESENVTEAGLRRFASQVMIEELVREELRTTVDEPSLELAQQALDEQFANLVRVCAAHILVASESEAADVRERLDAGEAFADLAGELSIDPGTAPAGGALECASASSFVTPFGETTLSAEIGVVTGPIETEFGFHLLIVESRTIPTVEEVRTAMLETAIDRAFDEWYVEAVVAATVAVEERFGVWVTEPTPEVIAPS